MAHVTARDVDRALRYADFPATKDQLIHEAQAAGASEEVVKALRALPPEVYRSRAEVVRSVPTDPAAEEGLSPAQVAEAARRARRHHPQRVSQSSLDVPKPPVQEELDE